MKLAHGQIEWANLRAKTPRRRKLAHFPDLASPNFFSDSCPVRQRRLGLRRRWRGLQRARLTRARYRRNLWTFSNTPHYYVEVNCTSSYSSTCSSANAKAAQTFYAMCCTVGGRDQWRPEGRSRVLRSIDVGNVYA